eukprot:CAMPEP_0113694346 /NCGR_PEP_ID=MMETSP0038_2-20120614/20230_1 /TAXON_ID=2898 /ORGANISM="Cryptomonas paramecium" /LENGTH=41 /DNA_ID=CAMNT_0000616641 /DNA_START=168 /DNA_END=290 /DNA_ORIENTATION=+ /assembly_acc=CAM_ASM_000170
MRGVLGRRDDPLEGLLVYADAIYKVTLTRPDPSEQPFGYDV